VPARVRRSPAPTPSRALCARLLAGWCAFTVYGSLIPFRLDVRSVPAKLEQLAWAPFERGVSNFSSLDVVANVLLFLPFGFLFHGAISPAPRHPRPAGVALAAFAALVFAAALEIAQLFAADRVASAIDVEANVAGAALGAALASLVFARMDRRGAPMIGRVRRDPALLGLAIVVAHLAAQSFYPFAVTLDVGTLADNLRSGRWWPFAIPDQNWADIVMDRIVPFALLAMLLGTATRSRFGRRWTGGLIASATAFALALELGKLFVVGRAPGMANVLLALPGIALGALAVSRVSAGVSTPVLAGFALLVLGHAELAPFAFDASASNAAQQVARIEWVPFLAYFRAPPQVALFDLWNKLLRGALLGFALARGGAGVRLVTAAGFAGGLAFETLQLLTVDRLASTTDVLVLGVAAWVGARVHAALGSPPASLGWSVDRAVSLRSAWRARARSTPGGSPSPCSPSS
jgi:VanZ family protein